jgi:hypothetical protein
MNLGGTLGKQHMFYFKTLQFIEDDNRNCELITLLSIYIHTLHYCSLSETSLRITYTMSRQLYGRRIMCTERDLQFGDFGCYHSMDLYIHSPIRLHGVVLNLLGAGTTLLLQFYNFKIDCRMELCHLETDTSMSDDDAPSKMF